MCICLPVFNKHQSKVMQLSLFAVGVVIMKYLTAASTLFDEDSALRW
jgi:hypothetical protein